MSSQMVFHRSDVAAIMVKLPITNIPCLARERNTLMRLAVLRKPALPSVASAGGGKGEKGSTMGGEREGKSERSK
jgi:hypothetical protein